MQTQLPDYFIWYQSILFCIVTFDMRIDNTNENITSLFSRIGSNSFSWRYLDCCHLLHRLLCWLRIHWYIGSDVGFWCYLFQYLLVIFTSHQLINKLIASLNDFVDLFYLFPFGLFINTLLIFIIFMTFYGIIEWTWRCVLFGWRFS